MRRRITEKNKFPVFDLEAEYKKIHALFFDKGAFGKPTGISSFRPCYSYNNCLQIFFLEWRLRGSFTSIEEMLFSLAISDDDFDNAVTEERLLDYIQFILNAVIFVNSKCRDGDHGIFVTDDSIGKAIIQNCHMILNELKVDTDFDDKEVFVYYRDDVADAISIEHRDIEPCIIDYLKIDTRGDIRHKEEILCTLAKKLEPLEKTLLSTEFKSLCEDTTFILNKIARHHLDPTQKIEAKISLMSQQEIEDWCDKGFNMFLACMAVVPYIQTKSDIKQLKRV